MKGRMKVATISTEESGSALVKKYAGRWFLWALVNIVIVALFGTLMRLKFAFPFPYLRQGFLLHAHSHFAFAGWVSHFLYSGLALLIFPYLDAKRRKKYNILVILNLFFAFGMLFSFTAQGYKAISITFSSLTIFLSWAYAGYYFRDLKFIPKRHPSRPWVIAGLIFNIVSCIGPFTLAYLMATETITSTSQNVSIYYYLHFQYNGWFFFSCIALIAGILPRCFSALKDYFPILVTTSILGYFLSLLWLDLPPWLYNFTALAAIAELVIWILLLIKFIPILRSQKEVAFPVWVRFLFYMVAGAFTLKVILQVLGVTPAYSYLTYSLRPIIIAYLHLILLGGYSLFIIAYLCARKYIRINKLTQMAAYTFLLGMVLNELNLAAQGAGILMGSPIPNVEIYLLIAAAVLLSGALMLLLSQSVKKKKSHGYPDRVLSFISFFLPRSR